MDEEGKAQKLQELKRQREELDKLISELTVPVSGSTNIPFAAVYTTIFPPYTSTVDFSAVSQEELLKMKIFINKKCNQLSTDFSHTLQLLDELAPLRDNMLFRELFLRKVLDQGRVQVSGHFESYKPLSFILFKLESPEMINAYVRLLIEKPGSETELKGMYAIYFGFLNLREDVDGCWLWLASVLNVKPNKFSGYVLETFLTICGDLMAEKIRAKFNGIVGYIRNHYIKELENAAVETRILNTISKYDKTV